MRAKPSALLTEHGIRLFHNAEDHLGIRLTDTDFEARIVDGVPIKGICLWCWPEENIECVAIETVPDNFEPLYCLGCLKGAFREKL